MSISLNIHAVPILRDNPFKLDSGSFQQLLNNIADGEEVYLFLPDGSTLMREDGHLVGTITTPEGYTTLYNFARDYDVKIGFRFKQESNSA